MKLRKHSGAKLAIVGATAALFGAFFALVHSHPLTASEPAAPATGSPDYGRFFQPNATPGAGGVVAPVQAPHTRTRAS
jgi:hypothetical protein